MSPSWSAYFGVAGQDARSVFGGMDDDAMHHIINDGSTADDAYTPSSTKKRKEEKKVASTARTTSQHVGERIHRPQHGVGVKRRFASHGAASFDKAGPPPARCVAPAPARRRREP
jgi:hypothetical protein